jgi:hypothetical protein
MFHSFSRHTITFHDITTRDFVLNANDMRNMQTLKSIKMSLRMI